MYVNKSSLVIWDIYMYIYIHIYVLTIKQKGFPILIQYYDSSLKKSKVK